MERDPDIELVEQLVATLRSRREGRLRTQQVMGSLATVNATSMLEPTFLSKNAEEIFRSWKDDDIQLNAKQRCFSAEYNWFNSPPSFTDSELKVEKMEEREKSFTVQP